MRWLLLLVAIPLGACLDVDRLLREGRASEVLARVRPVNPSDYRRRALALRALGQPRAAAEELRIAVALDPGAAQAQRALGFVEAQLGALGASLRAFEAAHRADPRDPTVRAALARLLVARARQRAQPALGQLEEARADRERAARLAGPSRASASKAAPTAPTSAASCPGPDPETTRPRIHAARRCTLASATREVEELERRDLLLGCRGAALAARLLERGCAHQAIRILEGLEREAPSDPRWSFLNGAAWLSLGEVARAQLRFVDGLYHSRERGPALLVVARLHLEAGHPRLAGGFAVDALAFPLETRAKAEAATILERSGHLAQANEARSAVPATSAPARRRPGR